MSWSKATRLPGISGSGGRAQRVLPLCGGIEGAHLAPPAMPEATAVLVASAFLEWCTLARRSTACTNDLVRADIPASAAPAFNTRGGAPTARRAQPTSETCHARLGQAPRGAQGASCVLGVRLRDGPRLQHWRAPRPPRDPPARRWPARADRRADRLALARLVPHHPRGGAGARDLGDELAADATAFSKSRRGHTHGVDLDVVARLRRRQQLADLLVGEALVGRAPDRRAQLAVPGDACAACTPPGHRARSAAARSGSSTRPSVLATRPSGRGCRARSGQLGEPRLDVAAADV